MQKRGLSNVVVAVLIVLISLVAISTLWVFVGTTIIGIFGGEENDGEISKAVACFDKDVKITECGKIEDDLYKISVKRGPGDFVLDEVIIKLVDGERREGIFLNSTNVPGEFGSVSYYLNVSGLGLQEITESSLALKIEGDICGFSTKFLCSESGAQGFGGGNGTGEINESNLTSDLDYLLNVSIMILQKQDGTKTFVATYNGRTLRSNFSDETFYLDRSGGNLQITYNIVERFGGVDVEYSVFNPTSSPQKVPDFRIDGIKILNTTSDEVYYLKAKSSAGMQRVDFSGANYIDKYYPSDYYSPVIVMSDKDYSAGSAIQYPYMEYKQNIRSTITIITNTQSPRFGTWSYRYRDIINANNSVDSVVPAGQTYTYNVTLRFAPKNNWPFTLYPYKKYFEGLYGVDSKNVSDRNREPVRGIQLGDGSLAIGGNPRGYRPVNGYGRIDRLGWGPFTDWFIQNSSGLGYTRVLIWTPGGVYVQPNPNNFPPQFMSDWVINATNSDGNFTKYAQNNLELGFWWGRSTEIPAPVQWDPPTLLNISYANQTQMDFLRNELDIAVFRGAKMIGLDKFTQMPVYERTSWIDEMKSRTQNQVAFLHESSGPDILHRKMPNYADPSNFGNIRSPDLLAWYLNPGSDIYVQGSGTYNSREFMKNMSKFGYTPLPKDSYVDAFSIRDNLIGCFDGIDNNEDGRTDYYDCGCLAGSEVETGDNDCLN